MKHRERLFVVLVIVAIISLAMYMSWYIQDKKNIANAARKTYVQDSIRHKQYMDSLNRVGDSIEIVFDSILHDLQSKASKYDSIMREQDESM